MSTAPTDDLVGEILDGRYRVLERLADGGMASVYLAVDTRLDREVALKVMRPHLAQDEAFRSRFHREARSAARLSHPGVVAVFDQGEDDGRMFLAMEYVPGQTLREVIQAEGALTPRAALDIMLPVLEALAAAHRAGIIHRDVKPENVILREDGAVKVADFGLARAVTSHTVTSSSGLLLGTVSYLSPEQVERGIADARSDVYAAGLVLFEMLTGAKAFDGDTAINVAYQHVHAGAPRLSSRVPDAPEILDELVAAATSRDPDGRPADAAAFAGLVRTARRELSADELDGRPTASEAGAVAATVTRTTALPVDGEMREMRERGAVAAAPSLRDQVRGAPPATAGVAARRSPVTRAQRRALWPWILVVVSAAIASATAWFFIAGPGAPTVVPAVVGKPVVAAESALRTAHLDATRRESFSETVAKGVVISSTPKATEEVRRGTAVTLVVSKGPERYAVPTLAGTSLAEATDRITGANLVLGKVTEKFDEKVAEGQVIASEPKAGTSLKRGTAVALTVSKGREPITVENFTGKPLAAAKAALGKAGLVVEVSGEENSDTVPAGSIIRQEPAGGTLFKGDKVTVVTSKGPVLVTIPGGLIGKQFIEVKGTLEGLGFTVRERQAIPGINFGTVQGLNPPEGSQQPKGSEIVVTTV
ncbi:Stk1 family PASTA domain-containing Ser/Thr kinase [Knoellia flava]|uniref:non-specific serine/threonine protein kinase n=3 Tax=Knoellia flava TaxID=913969 RepID=A0A8H9KTS6_9MICO|nr:Stk1 family PASTA domain-containing Ser/Thr kinase [Knoellia flava]GGB90587.1 serine/threonine protein kinase [Knoellia flava]